MTEESKDVTDNSDIYAVPTSDGLLNVVSGLGSAKARNPASYLAPDHRLDRNELENFYRFYWIAKAVDIRPWDMTRQWRTFECEDIDPKQVKAIENVEREVSASEKVRQALQWASLYGGAGIIMHVDGHGYLDKPLDYTKIKKGQLKRLSPVDRWELIESMSIEYNPLHPDFKTAEFYRVANDTTAQQIHRSRIIFFRGRDMPIRITRRLRGWGDPDVQRWYQAITNNETLASAIVEGVHQSNIDVVGVKGLANLLAMKGGEQKAMDRFMTMDMCKSMLNMSIIDVDDSFTRNAFPFSGLPDIYRVFLEVLASATDIPITRLLGSSPAGLNSTGEGDIRNYYDSIKSEQENKLAPKLNQLDEVLVRSALGDYPEDLTYEFDSLWQLTPEEEATLRQTQVSTLISLQQLGIDEYTLQKDAVEHGIVKNLSMEEIDAMQAADSFEDDGDDFEGGDDDDNGGTKKTITWQTDPSGKKFHVGAGGKKIYKQEK